MSPNMSSPCANVLRALAAAAAVGLLRSTGFA